MNTSTNYRYHVVSVLGILSLMATVASSAPLNLTKSTTTSTDVSVQIVADRDTVKAGEQITYTVTMTNNGPDDATFADVGMFASDKFQLVSITCDLGISADTPFCEYSSLPVGASVISTLVATPRTDIPIHGNRFLKTTATVFFENLDASDPDTGNNSASVKTKLLGGASRP